MCCRLQAELALLRLHNLSLSPVYEEGHMIKAKVVEVGRRAVTLDTGLKTARVARADIPPDCILGTTSQNAAPRRPGAQSGWLAALPGAPAGPAVA